MGTDVHSYISKACLSLIKKKQPVTAISAQGRESLIPSLTFL